MNPARALAAALRADKERQTLELWREVRRIYGNDCYYRNQAHSWWGWSLR